MAFVLTRGLRHHRYNCVALRAFMASQSSQPSKLSQPSQPSKPSKPSQPSQLFLLQEIFPDIGLKT